MPGTVQWLQSAITLNSWQNIKNTQILLIRIQTVYLLESAIPFRVGDDLYLIRRLKWNNRKRYILHTSVRSLSENPLR